MKLLNNKFLSISGFYMGKFIVFLIGALLLFSCSSAKLVHSWKNDKITTFKPHKLLVVGMTYNLAGRTSFEETLSKAFIKRHINTYKSIEVIDTTFSHNRQEETEINKMVAKLSKAGYDAIAVSAVKGIEKIERFNPDYYPRDYNWNNFGIYYNSFQDIYYEPNYFDKFEIYHIEFSIYNINEKETRSLVWIGIFDVVDPKSIHKTVKDYVASIMKELEREKLIVK